MTADKKILDHVLRGVYDSNIGFRDLCKLLISIGFQERIKGSHHIFTQDGIPEILNLQPKSGKAKPYQVKQVRMVILKYKLGGNDE